ncbi:MAG: twin-arginine translocase subunit TatB [Paracoccaceae bacterium]|nr:twin-arginine translocase subunit TatB [Paracoccaceae bacterium]
MFDLGWAELLLIGIIALIVMGDDFPSMFRTLGRFTGKMRKMAREFTRAMEEAADDAGVKDVTNTLKSAASPKSMGLDALNKAADNFEKWEAGTKRKISDPGKPAAAKSAKPKADPAPEPAADTVPEPSPAAETPEPQKTPDAGP